MSRSPSVTGRRAGPASANEQLHVPVKTPMTERRTKHSAQIKIDLFPQMRAGWWGSWGKMG
eukprot:COSAG02_NODE_4750_length_5026_cov_2.873960_6_plen_60_part_01